MGRLDDAAKRRVVELRKAGLSFRKIKAVLELENIKVSAQAIYLFLREFQGRPPGRVRPVEAGSSGPPAHVQVRAGASHNWSNVPLQNLLRDTTQHASYQAAPEFAKQTLDNSEMGAKASRPGETSRVSRPEHHNQRDKEENDIQIVSVTSLAQSSQQRRLQSAETAAVSSTGTASAAFMRRRVTPSPATNSMLAARKRLLDKALLHRAKSVQQVASLLRRDHSTVQGADFSGAMSQQPETYDLTSEKTGNQPGGSNFPKRFLTQRPVLSVRSLHPVPRVGIRLPPEPLTSSGGAAIRLQTTGGQGTAHSDGKPSSQLAVHDVGGRCGLQEQIQSLGSEVCNLGQAVKMLVEHQSRLEKEQVQQTHIQKQILGTLQSLVSKLGPSTNKQQCNKTASPSVLPTVSASTSFSQNTFNFSQGTYSQCSQTQPSYNSMESLEHVEAFTVPGLSPTSMNGFPPCSSAERLTLTHTPPQSQPYATEYTQQHSQRHLSSYTQPYVSTYSPSPSQSFRGSESKAHDFSGSLQDCSVSSQPSLNSTHSPQDQQVNNIKVEAP